MSQAALGLELKVAGQTDVLPPEWREVFEQRRVEGPASIRSGSDGAG